MSIASKFKQMSESAVDRTELTRVFNLIVKDIEKRAQHGETETPFHLLENSDFTFDYHQWNATDAFQVAMKQKFETEGFRIIERFGVNGMYGVISWK